MKNPPKTARKTPEPAKTPEVPTSQQVTADKATSETAENDDEIERIGIPINKKTGLPAWNRMRKPEEAKATLRLLARDPAISGGTSGAEQQALVPLCAQAVMLLGVIAQSAAKKAGYSNPHVMAVAGDEAMGVGSLAVAVLVKYQATMKYAEEWMLGAALVGMFGAKYAQLEKPTSAFPSVPGPDVAAA